MTVIVGVRCSDGIVIGADSAATSTAGPQPVLRTDTDKIFLVGARYIVAGTGAVGLTQRFCQVLEAAHKGKVLDKKDALETGKILAKQALEDFQRTYVQRHPQLGLSFGVLLGGVFGDATDLIEFATTDFQPEVKKDKLFFGSMGSGQPLADPFIAFIKRVLWRDAAPTVDVAMIGVYWALSHTIICAPGYVGNPISLAVLKQKDGRWQPSLLGEAELQEKALHIEALEQHLAGYVPKAIAEAETTPPPPPPGQETPA